MKYNKAVNIVNTYYDFFKNYGFSIEYFEELIDNRIDDSRKFFKEHHTRISIDELITMEQERANKFMQESDNYKLSCFMKDECYGRLKEIDGLSWDLAIKRAKTGEKISKEDYDKLVKELEYCYTNVQYFNKPYCEERYGDALMDLAYAYEDPTPEFVSLRLSHYIYAGWRDKEDD